MDSNNFPDNVGVGEREARVASSLVYRRHFGLAHGVGRSGDIAAEQPKAAGSTLLAKLARILLMDSLRLAGLGDVGAATLVPMATGMAMTLVLLALRRQRPRATVVLWPRIDQKTCIKCVVGLGLELVVIENRLEGDELRTDMDALRAALEEHGAESVLCVLTTTSCFAPRGHDAVVEVAKMCEHAEVPHVINNAYGIQSTALCTAVTQAWRRGRVDAVVQSTDKNFMVPVGGAVITAGAKRPELVRDVERAYPGRAANTAAIDILITLLSLGANRWQALLKEREALYPYLVEQLEKVAGEVGERVLRTPHNPISVAVTLDTFAGEGGPGVTFLGSMLFSRCVSGTRTVGRGGSSEVAGRRFAAFGSHADAYPHAYFTAAAAVGTTREEVDVFCARLRKCFADHRKKLEKAKKKDVALEEAPAPAAEP